MFQDSTALLGDYEHYYSNDPAFDKKSEDFDHERWVETKNDKFLPRNGGRPVRFVLRRLTSREKRLLGDVGSLGSQEVGWWAVALALKKVDPAIVAGEDKGDMVLPRVRDAEWKAMRVTDDWMDMIDSVDEGGLFWELANRVCTEVFGSPRG